MLGATAAKHAAAHAFDELELPTGATPDEIAACFRSKCLRRAIRLLSGAAAEPDNQREEDVLDDQDAKFQRQVVAYRFLSSLPLLGDRRDDAAISLLAKLRPVGPVADPNIRASAMLDVVVTRVERAQQTYGLPYASYVLSVHYCLRRHVVRRRYREFQELDSALAMHLPVLPELPPRDWRANFGGSSTLVVARAQALTQYLARVIQLLITRGRFSVDFMNFLEIDHARVRAEEEALAVAMLSTWPSADAYYVVDVSWLDAWKRFVQALGPPPGGISNEKLFQGRTRVLKDALTIAQHYRCVNSATWAYLYGVYGGGPVIARRSPSIYAAPASDTVTLAIQAQRIVRGFLARREARRRKIIVLKTRPDVARLVNEQARNRELEKRMEAVRNLVRIREFQACTAAARIIQRAYRRHNARAEHALLLAESAAPDGAALELLAQLDEDHLTLAEMSLLPADRRLGHFLAAMSRGVPLRKLRSRWKVPKWRLFSIDSIGAQLLWTSKRLQRRQWNKGQDSGITRALAFVDVIQVEMEAPLRLHRVPLVGRRVSCDYAVVLHYRADGNGGDGSAKDLIADNNNNNNNNNNNQGKKGALKELALVCESAGEMEALAHGLQSLVQEVAARVAGGATYVDGHGVIRRKVPHAKGLLRSAGGAALQYN